MEKLVKVTIALERLKDEVKNSDIEADRKEMIFMKIVEIANTLAAIILQDVLPELQNEKSDSVPSTGDKES